DDVVFASPRVSRDLIASFTGKNPGVPLLVARDIFRQDEEKVAGDAKSVRFVSNPSAYFFPAAPNVLRHATAKGIPAESTGGYFVYAYAATQAVALLSQRSGGPYPDKMAGLARSSELATVLGNLSFDETGDVKNWQFALWQRASLSAAPGFSEVDVC